MFPFDKDWKYLIKTSLHGYQFCFSKSIVAPCYRKEYNLMAATDLMLFGECLSLIPLDRFRGFQIYVSFLKKKDIQILQKMKLYGVRISNKNVNKLSFIQNYPYI